MTPLNVQSYLEIYEIFMYLVNDQNFTRASNLKFFPQGTAE